jgi:hypothetical protein
MQELKVSHGATRWHESNGFAAAFRAFRMISGERRIQPIVRVVERFAFVLKLRNYLFSLVLPSRQIGKVLGH